MHDKMNCEPGGEPQIEWLTRALRSFLIPVVVFFLAACATASKTTVSRQQAEQPQGFFDRIIDQVTERECNVGRFICPYGLGPAGEPCECTEPSGVVRKGRTIK